MKKIQREINLAVSGLHIREAEGEQQSRVIEGHAVVFGQRSVNLTPWSSMRELYEIMEPGSISQELINKSDVVLTAFHNNELILGRSTNGKGTLPLSLDDTGVAIRCELPHTSTADDMLELIRRGDISGMSFCYTCDEEDNENGVAYERTTEQHDGKEVWLRHVKSCTGLYDVTIAGHPAYQGTDVENRDMDSAIDSIIQKTAVVETPEQKENREADEAAEQARQEAALRERQRNIALMEKEIEMMRMENF